MFLLTLLLASAGASATVGLIPAATGCVELARPLATGAVLSDRDVVAVPCDEKAAPAPLQFDRRERVVRVEGDLAAGAYLGRVSLPSTVAVDKGAKLTLISTSGPVRITREVVALQVGRPGGKIFVKDSEGNVTSVQLAVEEGRGE
jgi:flagella basal body P-ring formation protein FlgA